MQIPITRVLVQTSIHTLAPTVTALNSHLPASMDLVDAPRSSSTTSTAHTPVIAASLNCIERRIVRLFGMINTDRIVGPCLLRYIVSRNFSSAARLTPTDGSAIFDPMNEPYGSIIKSLQGKFLKAGLFKIHENRFSVTFSDGVHQLQIVIDPNNLPSEVGYFVSTNGEPHFIKDLQKRFNPEAFFKELGDLKNILDKFSVEEIAESQAFKDEGIRDYLSLSFRQMINFMESNKTALSKL